VNRQKQYLDAVLESSADGILLLDPQHRIIRFNRACSRLTGFDPEEVIGRPQEEVLRWLRREPGPTLEQAEADGWPLSPQATHYLEGDLRRRDGGVMSVGITYAPIVSGEGRLVSIVANLRDITRFREAEELKSTFVSIVGHELRTPVALIKGYVGTLRRDDAAWDPDVVRDSLTVIEDEADRLAGLIDDLLDASRLQAGALSLDLGEVSVAPLLERLVTRFRTQAPGRRFTLDVPTDLPIVRGDEGRLTQVVSNLLSNAVKYSPDGSEIRVRAEMTPAQIVVCVSDEGRGIDPADAPHVFERFYRSTDVARNTQGAGLGLFLARAIVEAHGGSIWVDPRAPRGATLCFSLPRD
jgi:PAS domain S-box-containing protein